MKHKLGDVVMLPVRVVQASYTPKGVSYMVEPLVNEHTSYMLVYERNMEKEVRDARN